MKTAIQKVQFVGQVGDAPKTDVVGLAHPIIRFSFGVSERYQNQEGKSTSYTIWHNVILVGHLAKEYRKLKKGHLIRLTGRMFKISWMDQKGVYRTSTKIKATQLSLIH